MPDAAQWLDILEKRLRDRRLDNGETLGLDTLNNYAEGRPRPPRGAEKAQEAWRAFQRMSRTNYCIPVLRAVVDRLRMASFYTAATDDENGDQLVAEFWRVNDMHARERHIYWLAGTMRDAYVMVSDPRSAAHGHAVVTIEDPRFTITDEDPLTGEVRAALKIVHDETLKLSRAFVQVRGEGGAGCSVTKYTREWNALGRVDAVGNWTQDGDAVTLTFPDPTIVRYSIGGVAEHEPAIDIVDRINSGILLRMVVAFSQAFRKIGFTKTLDAEVLAPDVQSDDPDDPGSPVAEVDLGTLFENSPAAMWDFPYGWQPWESAVTDLTPLLAAETKDLQHLAAVTRTPMDYLVPDGANQSAEGAALKRENLLARVEDRQASYGSAHARVVRLAMLWRGDAERADLAGIRPQWRPAQQPSLAERSAAAVQQKAAGVPWRTLMRGVLGYSPEDVADMEVERDADLLYAQENAAPAPAQPTVQPAQPPAASGG